jgi:hypothetical protein
MNYACFVNEAQETILSLHLNTVELETENKPEKSDF